MKDAEKVRIFFRLLMGIAEIKISNVLIYFQMVRLDIIFEFVKNGEVCYIILNVVESA